MSELTKSLSILPVDPSYGYKANSHVGKHLHKLSAFNTFLLFICGADEDLIIISKNL